MNFDNGKISVKRWHSGSNPPFASSMAVNNISLGSFSYRSFKVTALGESTNQFGVQHLLAKSRTGGAVIECAMQHCWSFFFH